MGDSVFHRISSSDYAELSELSCSTDYARNLNGFRPSADGILAIMGVRKGVRKGVRMRFAICVI